MHSEITLFALFRNNVRRSLSFYIYCNLSDCHVENARGLKADTYLSMFVKFSHGDYNGILFVSIEVAISDFFITMNRITKCTISL